MLFSLFSGRRCVKRASASDMDHHMQQLPVQMAEVHPLQTTGQSLNAPRQHPVYAPYSRHLHPHTTYRSRECRDVYRPQTETGAPHRRQPVPNHQREMLYLPLSEQARYRRSYPHQRGPPSSQHQAAGSAAYAQQVAGTPVVSQGQDKVINPRNLIYVHQASGTSVASQGVGQVFSPSTSVHNHQVPGTSVASQGLNDFVNPSTSMYTNQMAGTPVASRGYDSMDNPNRSMSAHQAAGTLVASHGYDSMDNPNSSMPVHQVSGTPITSQELDTMDITSSGILLDEHYKSLRIGQHGYRLPETATQNNCKTQVYPHGRQHEYQLETTVGTDSHTPPLKIRRLEQCTNSQLSMNCVIGEGACIAQETSQKPKDTDPLKSNLSSIPNSPAGYENETDSNGGQDEVPLDLTLKPPVEPRQSPRKQIKYAELLKKRREARTKAKLTGQPSTVDLPSNPSVDKLGQSGTSSEKPGHTSLTPSEKPSQPAVKSLEKPSQPSVITQELHHPSVTSREKLGDPPMTSCEKPGHSSVTHEKSSHPSVTSHGKLGHPSVTAHEKPSHPSVTPCETPRHPSVMSRENRSPPAVTPCETHSHPYVTSRETTGPTIKTELLSPPMLTRVTSSATPTSRMVPRESHSVGPITNQGWRSPPTLTRETVSAPPQVLCEWYEDGSSGTGISTIKRESDSGRKDGNLDVCGIIATSTGIRSIKGSPKMMSKTLPSDDFGSSASQTAQPCHRESSASVDAPISSVAKNRASVLPLQVSTGAVCGGESPGFATHPTSDPSASLSTSEQFDPSSTDRQSSVSPRERGGATSPKDCLTSTSQQSMASKGPTTAVLDTSSPINVQFAQFHNTCLLFIQVDSEVYIPFIPLQRLVFTDVPRENLLDVMKLLGLHVRSLTMEEVHTVNCYLESMNSRVRVPVSIPVTAIKLELAERLYSYYFPQSSDIALQEQSARETTEALETAPNSVERPAEAGVQAVQDEESETCQDPIRDSDSSEDSVSGSAASGSRKTSVPALASGSDEEGLSGLPASGGTGDSCENHGGEDPECKKSRDTEVTVSTKTRKPAVAKKHKITKKDAVAQKPTIIKKHELAAKVLAAAKKQRNAKKGTAAKVLNAAKKRSIAKNVTQKYTVAKRLPGDKKALCSSTPGAQTSVSIAVNLAPAESTQNEKDTEQAAPQAGAVSQGLGEEFIYHGKTLHCVYRGKTKYFLVSEIRLEVLNNKKDYRWCSSTLSTKFKEIGITPTSITEEELQIFHDYWHLTMCVNRNSKLLPLRSLKKIRKAYNKAKKHSRRKRNGLAGGPATLERVPEVAANTMSSIGTMDAEGLLLLNQTENKSCGVLQIRNRSLRFAKRAGEPMVLLIDVRRNFYPQMPSLKFSYMTNSFKLNPPRISEEERDTFCEIPYDFNLKQKPSCRNCVLSVTSVRKLLDKHPPSTLTSCESAAEENVKASEKAEYCCDQLPEVINQKETVKTDQNSFSEVTKADPSRKPSNGKHLRESIIMAAKTSGEVESRLEGFTVSGMSEYTKDDDVGREEVSILPCVGVMMTPTSEPEDTTVAAPVLAPGDGSPVTSEGTPHMTFSDSMHNPEREEKTKELEAFPSHLHVSKDVAQSQRGIVEGESHYEQQESVTEAATHKSVGIPPTQEKNSCGEQENITKAATHKSVGVTPAPDKNSLGNQENITESATNKSVGITPAQEKNSLGKQENITKGATHKSVGITPAQEKNSLGKQENITKGATHKSVGITPAQEKNSLGKQENITKGATHKSVGIVPAQGKNSLGEQENITEAATHKSVGITPTQEENSLRNQENITGAVTHKSVGITPAQEKNSLGEQENITKGATHKSVGITPTQEKNRLGQPDGVYQSDLTGRSEDTVCGEELFHGVSLPYIIKNGLKYLLSLQVKDKILSPDVELCPRKFRKVCRDLELVTLEITDSDLLVFRTAGVQNGKGLQLNKLIQLEDAEKLVKFNLLSKTSGNIEISHEKVCPKENPAYKKHTLEATKESTQSNSTDVGQKDSEPLNGPRGYKERPSFWELVGDIGKSLVPTVEIKKESKVEERSGLKSELEAPVPLPAEDSVSPREEDSSAIPVCHKHPEGPQTGTLLESRAKNCLSPCIICTDCLAIFSIEEFLSHSHHGPDQDNTTLSWSASRLCVDKTRRCPGNKHLWHRFLKR